MTRPKKPKPPRPVRAWAIVGPRAGMYPVIVNSDRAFLRSLCFSNRGERIVRVTIVPDGAPSAEAEVRRLRREIRFIRGRVQELRFAHLTGRVLSFDPLLKLIDAALRRPR